MNIFNCPDCGGTHYGSAECPIKHPPAPSRTLDLALACIDRDRKRLQSNFDQKMAELDRRERSLLGLKEE